MFKVNAPKRDVVWSGLAETYGSWPFLCSILSCGHVKFHRTVKRRGAEGVPWFRRPATCRCEDCLHGREKEHRAMRKVWEAPRPSKLDALRSRRARLGYFEAVEWIARNDNSGNGDSFDDVTGYVTTALVADLFGVQQSTVAEHVIARRRELGYEVGKNGGAL